MLCPASGCPVSRVSGAPRILLLTRAWPNMQAGTGTCSGPGRGNCATPGFVRTDVGMPVADDRIDMCRTGPPCNATAGKAGYDTMDSPALPAVLTGAPSPAFPVGKTGAAVRFSLRSYAGMVRREASGARCEPATGDVRSAQARLTAGRAGCRHPGNTRSLPADRRPVPHRNIPYREQESGRKLRACTLPQTGPCTRAIFPLFFSLNFRRNPGETGWQHTDRTASHTACFVPCRSGTVLCRVISRLKIDVSDRDALPGRIHPRIHRKSLRAYFIIHFGYSGRSDPYP